MKRSEEETGIEIVDNNQDLSPGHQRNGNPFARGGTNAELQGGEIARKYNAYNAWSPNEMGEESEDEYIPGQDNNKSIEVTRETFMKSFGLDDDGN